MKKLLLGVYYVIIVIFISSIVTALDTTDNYIYLSFDNDTVSGTIVENLADITNNGSKVANNEPPQRGGGAINDYVQFDGVNDYIDVADTATSEMGRTIAFWYLPDVDCTSTSATFRTVIGDDNTNYPMLICNGNGFDGNFNGFGIYTSTNTGATFAENTLNAGQFVHVVFTWNNTAGRYDIYLNGTREGVVIGSYLGTHAEMWNGDYYRLARRGTGAVYPAGIDEFNVWNRSLTATEVFELYNATINPYEAAPITPSEDIKKKVIDIRGLQGLDNATTLNSIIYTPIISTTYQTLFSNNSIYIDQTYSLRLNSLPSRTSECRINVDGNTYNSTNSYELNTADSIRSTSSRTDIFHVTNPSLINISYECRLTQTGNNIDIINPEITINVLKDNKTEKNITIYTPKYVSNFNTNSFIKIGSHSFIADNTFYNTTKNLTYNLDTNGIVINYSSTGSILYYYEINISGTLYNTSIYNRSGVVGSSGTGSANFVHQIINGSNITTSLYAKGNGDITSNPYIQVYAMSDNRFNYTNISSKNINTTNYKDIKNITVYSDGYIQGFAVINMRFDATDTVGIFRVVEGNDNSIETYRSGNINTRGIAIVPYFFDTSIGETTLRLQAKIQDDGNIMNITAGEIVVYNTYSAISILNTFNITAHEFFNKTSILGFNVTDVNGNVRRTSTGLISYPYNPTIDEFLNLTIRSKNHYVENVLNHNVETNLNQSMYYYYNYSVLLSNFTRYTGINYTRSLNFNLSYYCPDFTISNYSIKIGNTENNYTLSCANKTKQVLTVSYKAPSERTYNVTSYITSAIMPSVNNRSIYHGAYLWDLFNPRTIINLISVEGFNDNTATLRLRCIDNVSSILFYNLTFNGDNLDYSNQSNNTLITNTSIYADGDNTLTGQCSDFFGSTTETNTTEVYSNTLYLINEITGGAFDPDNITSAIIYYDDNSSSWDVNGTATAINFTAIGNSKLRIELTYSDGGIVTRYIDLALLDDDVRICANLEGVTHTPQLITSSSERAVYVKSVFANCYVGVDYTRFAYQTAYVLQVFTIDRQYSLFIPDDDTLRLLASLDGSISSDINLDTLEFTQNAYDVNILNEDIAIQKTTGNNIVIKYQNQRNDNDNLQVTLIRSDTSEVLLTESYSDVNNFSITFDYSTLADITDETKFKVTTVSTKSDDSIVTRSKYFDVSGNVGVISATLGLLISLLIYLFGMTLLNTKSTFSYFGILVSLISIVILAMTVQEWYVLFISGIQLILLVYIVLATFKQNLETVA